MENIKIRINKLGAIRDSEIRLNQLVILSGESGLGKSYVAFLLHYIYKLFLEGRISRFFEEKGCSFETLFTENQDNKSVSFLSSELLFWINKDAADYLKDLIGNSDLDIDISIDIPFKKQEFVFLFSKERVEGSKNELEFYYFEMEDGPNIRFSTQMRNLGVLPFSVLLSDYLKSELFGNVLLEQTFLMAPGRGALLNVGAGLQDFIKSNSGLYSEFLRDWQIVKEMMPSGESDIDLQVMLRKINGGAVLKKDQQILFQLSSTDTLTMPIAAAASSVKELAPLAMLLDKYPVNRLSILFEEPEAHLHPSKQMKMADFIIMAINKGAHIQITTHSDYFIRRLNDRISLDVIKKNNNEAYNKLLKEKRFAGDFTLNSSVVQAYLLKRRKDGFVKIVSQSLKSGIPYDSFFDVLQKEFINSIEISRAFSLLTNAE